ncbi:toxic anion resistance protein [Novosphingobium sp. AAP1]|uniref:toxic anion resistance protein n=1 Tax=unclassified Novosphingobium TaxID=2644732 RepID=UPI0003B516B7|nr:MULTISPECIES: toxic anion resistance protein [unclassified Novosphingobium]KPF53136.1 toxic anion resistance protein [Novosphingobium sp. AAP1]
MSQLALIAPDPVAAVPVEQAAGLVPVSDEVRTHLQGKVDAYVADLLKHDTQSPEFGKVAGQLASIGQKEIVALSSVSSRFLDMPATAMGNESGVGRALLDLRTVIDRLDPAREGDLLKPRKLLGIIPFGNRIKAYFDRYASAQDHIQAIITSLVQGKDELLQDNIAIETERDKIWELMDKLEQMIVVTKMLDTKLEKKCAELDSYDPAKSRAMRENALFCVRQRQTDLLTQMTVSVQGYLALDLIRKNNVELIKGVDRATTTTIAALRTAVTVAQALNNQRLVLNQITALNSTTAGMIESTGNLLRTQTTAIHEQAASATIQVEVLQRAFQNIYATMDAVDSFKLKALDAMKATINSLSVETEKAQDYITRAQGAGPSTGDFLPTAN